MKEKEIALKLTETIVKVREDGMYYTEKGVLELYERVLKRVIEINNKLTKEMEEK